MTFTVKCAILYPINSHIYNIGNTANTVYTVQRKANAANIYYLFIWDDL